MGPILIFEGGTKFSGFPVIEISIVDPVFSNWFFKSKKCESLYDLANQKVFRASIFSSEI